MIAQVAVNPATIRSRPRLPCYCTFCIMVLQVYANYVYLFFEVVIIAVNVTDKTYSCHIDELLLKVMLNIITLTLTSIII
jgi:hypothetical protein